MSWIIKIEVVAEEHADAVLEVLRNAEEEVELEFSFNTSKVNNEVAPGLENVQAYFHSVFLEYDPFVIDKEIIGGKEMPIESVCGNDCEVAIDSAVAFCRHVKAAGGSDSAIYDTARISCQVQEVCEIYING